MRIAHLVALTGLCACIATAQDTAKIDLSRLLLARQFGAATPQTHFWDEGLVGYVASQAGRRSYDTEAGIRCRQLLADGLLPPIQELVVEAESRVSAVVTTAASGFAEYYDPGTGEPLGGGRFTWTAAMVLEFVEPMDTAPR